MDCPLASQILGDEVGRAASPPIQASGGYSMHSEAGLGRKLPVVHRLLILVQMMKGQVQKFLRVGRTRFQVGNIIAYYFQFLN